MADGKFPCTMLLGGFRVNHLKRIKNIIYIQGIE